MPYVGRRVTRTSARTPSSNSNERTGSSPSVTWIPSASYTCRNATRCRMLHLPGPHPTLAACQHRTRPVHARRTRTGVKFLHDCLHLHQLLDVVRGEIL